MRDCRVARFSGEVLAGADSLRLVAHTGGSVASLASEEFYDRGMRIVSANKIFAESVAEAALAGELATGRFDAVLDVFEIETSYAMSMTATGTKSGDYR
jgi:phosphoglycerate dehydrogenase-like enzyme